MKEFAVALVLSILVALGTLAAFASWLPRAAPTPVRAATIEVEDFHFTPNRLDVTVGVPVSVRLVNTGTERHDLNFPSIHMPGLEGAQSILEPGESRTITLRFDAPGTHVFSCSLPGHAAAGMTGAVFVQEVT